MYPHLYIDSDRLRLGTWRNLERGSPDSMTLQPGPCHNSYIWCEKPSNCTGMQSRRDQLLDFCTICRNCGMGLVAKSYCPVIPARDSSRSPSVIYPKFVYRCVYISNKYTVVIPILGSIRPVQYSMGYCLYNWFFNAVCVRVCS